jgi:hypothetical protein
MHSILSGNSTFNTNRLREKSVYVQNFIGLYVWDNRSIPRRMLKKVVQQGRSERRGEEVRTALRVGRSPLEWILANG